MRYFVVRAENPSNQAQLEIDIPLRQMWPLIAGIEAQLRSQRVFEPQERLLKRLVPRHQPGSGSMSVQMVDEIPPDLGEFNYGIYFEEGQEEPPRPIHELSVWVCSTPASRMCAVNLPVDRLFRSALEHLRQEMARKGQAREADRLDFSVFLHAGARTRVPRMLLLLPAQPPPPEIRTLDRKALSKSPIKVTVTNRESLVVPEERSWRDYGAEPVGGRRNGDLRILLNRRVIHQLGEVASDSLWQDAEVGGFLIGDVYKDGDGELFVDVSDIVAADQATGTFVDLRFNEDAWQEVFEEIQRRFPTKRRVGWYHTHLVGRRRLQPVTMPEARGRPVYELVDSFFFSSADVFLHRHFFPEPWHVALVVNLTSRTIMFYQWKGKEIASCNGYYVYEQDS